MSKKTRTKMKLPSKQNKDARHFNSTKEKSDAILQTDRQDQEEGYILRRQNPNVDRKPIATKVSETFNIPSPPTNVYETKERNQIATFNIPMPHKTQISIKNHQPQMYTRPKRGIKLRPLTSLCKQHNQNEFPRRPSKRNKPYKEGKISRKATPRDEKEQHKATNPNRNDTKPAAKNQTRQYKLDKKPESWRRVPGDASHMRGRRRSDPRRTQA